MCSNLDYGDFILFPIPKSHIRMMETVQRRDTRGLPELRHLSYCDRLKEQNYRHFCIDIDVDSRI